jgi:hypothetical protein
VLLTGHVLGKQAYLGIDWRDGKSGRVIGYMLSGTGQVGVWVQIAHCLIAAYRLVELCWALNVAMLSVSL